MGGCRRYSQPRRVTDHAPFSLSPAVLLSVFNSEAVSGRRLSCWRLAVGVTACVLSLTANPLVAQPLPDSVALRNATRVIDSLLRGNDDLALARAYRRLGDVHDSVDNAAPALEAYSRAITRGERVGDSVTLAAVYNNVGLRHWTANRYDSALTYLTKARAIRQARGDRVGLSRVLNSLGASHYQLGNYEPALDAFWSALELRRRDSTLGGVSVVYTNIGKTYHDWRQFDRALPMLENGVATALAEQEPVAAGYALNSLAMLYLDRGDFARARKLIDSSVATYNRARSRMTRNDSLSGWSLNAIADGLLLVRQGRAAEGLPLLDSVLQLGEQRESIRGQAWALLYLGEAYGRLGDRGRAIAALNRSVALASTVSQRVLILDALAQLATLEERAGNTRGALAHLRSYQALRDTIFDQSTAQRVASMEARAETERAQRLNAQLRNEQLEQSLELRRSQLAVALGTIILALAATLVALLVHFNRKGHARELLLAETNESVERANAELRTALSEVRALSGLIPICAKCKKVRDDEGFWEAVETYITNRSEATFSHGICTSCGPELYGEHWPEDDFSESTQS